jgi:hypothetical protein
MGKLIVTHNNVVSVSTEQQFEEDESGDVAVRMFEGMVYEHYLYAEEELGISGTLRLLDWIEEPPTLEAAVKQALMATTLKECRAILMRAWVKRGKGRPPKVRIPAVKALFYKIMARWTLRRVTDRFCPCGKSEHTDLCRDSLRKTIGQLKKQLKKYELEIRPW